VHQVALDVLHAQLPQHRHGVRVLDALGDGLDVLCLGLFHQRPYALLQVRAAGEALDEGAVDLHVVHRHRFDQPLRIAPGAKALNGEAESAAAQFGAEALHPLQMACDHIFLGLEAQPVGIRPGRTDLVLDPAHERSILQCLVGQAHEQAARLALRGEGQ
jgi:hypothetical protein